MAIRYKPYESHGLDSLVGALGSGLDPQVGLQLFQQIQGGALDRMAQNRQLRQSSLAGITDALSQTAATNPDPLAGQSLVAGMSETLPGLNKPVAQNKLEGLVNQFYPQQGSPSPMYQDPNGTPASATALDPDAIAGIAADAHKAAIGDTPTGVPIPLHDARMQIMIPLRAQGYSDAALQQAYDLIGHAYVAAGGQAGATPVDTLSRLSPPPPAAAAPQDPGTVKKAEDFFGSLFPDNWFFQG